MKALQTHAQMLEPSLGFFENEWSVLLQFLLGQGYKLSIRVNGFFVIRPGEDACFSRCLNLLEIVNEALACMPGVSSHPVRSFMRSRGIGRLYGSRSTVVLSGNGCS